MDRTHGSARIRGGLLAGLLVEADAVGLENPARIHDIALGQVGLLETADPAAEGTEQPRAALPTVAPDWA
jgi:hypothetical protein